MAKASHSCSRAQGSKGPRGRTGDTSQHESKTWALSPSDFVFLWDECPRCFYKKVVLKKPRPRSPFPRVFGTIDRAMKDFYVGRRFADLGQGAPAGVIESPDRWLKSRAIWVPGCQDPLVIRGRADALVSCDDGTVGVIDFKTAEAKDPHLTAYGRQLQAYAAAIEHPAVGRAMTVSALGLACFVPQHFEADAAGASLKGEFRWVEVNRDERAFNAFLREVLMVLGEPEAPPPSENCPWCERLGQW